MLDLNVPRRGFVLPQLDVSGFVDSTWRGGLTLSGKWMGVGSEETRGWEGGGAVDGMENEKNFFLQKKMKCVSVSKAERI